VPEVGLISSWYINQSSNRIPKGLPGITEALAEGISYIDLYVLDHGDIAWYAKKAKATAHGSPQTFFANLNDTQLIELANTLNKLKGKKKKYRALATFFPSCSIVEKDKISLETREMAIKAMRNTVYLAYL